MTKEEFEKISEQEVTCSDYQIIETVYTWYPGISEVYGKQQVAELYKIYGMSIFNDMFKRAQRIYELDSELQRRQYLLDCVKADIASLKNGEDID